MASIPESLAVAMEHHRGGRLRPAGQIYREILRVDPNHAGALHLLGLLAHQSGDHQSALEQMTRAADAAPHSAAIHNNLASAYKAVGRLEEAVASSRRALELNPDFAEAYNNLGNALRAQGKLEEAVASYRHALRINPGLVGVHTNLGNALKAQGKLGEAAASYRRALEIRPGYAEAHNSLGGIFHCQERYEDALKCFQRAVELKPDYPHALANLAGLYEQLNRVEEAASAAARALRAAPDHPLASLVAAKCQSRQGRRREAIDRLSRIVPRVDPATDVARGIHFELGRLYDRLGEPDRAFACFSEGNRLVSEHVRGWQAQRQGYLQMLRNLSEAFTREWVDGWTPAAEPAADETPAFLVGFPRSGTTLLDVILDSHPGIQTLEEKPAVSVLEEEVQRLPGGYPRALADLSAAELKGLRAVYFRMVDHFVRRQPGRILLDKLPLNIVSTGLILRVFPAAKLIVAVRHPCDVCLSCFMQNFKSNAGMANFFTLKDAALLYDKVMGLWRQYREVLPHAHHVVRYEDLIGDFEGQTRRLLEFLGVGWDEAVRAYAEHARLHRQIQTPSYRQVVQPIYRRARFRWRRYARHLAPVMDVLRPHMQHFGYQDVPASDHPSSPC